MNKEKPPFFLIIGDEFLTITEAKSIAKNLIGDNDNVLPFQLFDGAICDYHEIDQELSTYSLFGGNKVVILTNLVLKKEKYETESLIQSAIETFEKNNRKKAAAILWLIIKEEFPTRSSTVEDIRKSEIENWIKQKGDTAFQVYQYILSNKVKPPEREENVLFKLIERGIPDSHHLIITVPSISPSNVLYAALQKKGIIIDKEKDEKKGSSLHSKELLKSIFPAFEKQKDAYDTFNRLVGDNFRLYANELQKLAVFAGEKGMVSKDDVLHLVSNYRELEFFEFSQSLCEKNLKKSLEMFEKDYESGKHPLQILAIFASTLRQLILDVYICKKIFINKPKNFPQFRKFEKDYLPNILQNLESLGNKKIHPFALYKRLERAKEFHEEKLVSTAKKTFDCDRELKSGGLMQKVLLESLIFDICRA